MEGMKYIAYIYRPDSRYSLGIKIEDSVEQIASFIVKTDAAPQIVITDNFDNFILNTMYGFIDRCPDQKFLLSLLPTLIAMQTDDKAPEELRLGWQHWMRTDNEEEYTEEFKEECKRVIKEEFGIAL